MVFLLHPEDPLRADPANMLLLRVRLINKTPVARVSFSDAGGARDEDRGSGLGG
jgi:hypothetical protein